MVYPRWYPSATLLPDGRIHIMGGTQAPGSGTKANPISELWDPSRPTTTRPTTSMAMDPAYAKDAGDIYYPNNYMLPSGHMLTYCGYVGQIVGG